MICSATSKSGEKCRAHCVRGTERCAAHSGVVGAPAGNDNRKTHGFYSATTKLGGIDDVVRDLLGKQEQLSTYIDEQVKAGIDSEELVKLLALSAQNASRLGRLLRDQRALSSETADGLAQAIGRVLDEINAKPPRFLKVKL